jgi:plasmid replication initiation protein
MQGLDQPRAIFQLINWRIFDHFTGKYEAILYKLCRDYAGVRRTPYFTVQELRDYMGVGEKEYPLFKDFNKWCITKAAANINDSEIADIVVTPVPKIDPKNGRTVLGLYFEVDRKHQQYIQFEEFKENPAFASAKVTLEPSVQAEYLAIRSPEDIVLCIERGNEYGEGLSKQGKPANYGAIYRKAISEGWHTQHIEKKKIAEEEENRKQAQKDQEVRQKDQIEEEEAARKRLDSQVWASFLELSEELQDEQIRAVLEGKSIALAQYVKKGKTAPIVKSAVIAHLKSKK